MRWKILNFKVFLTLQIMEKIGKFKKHRMKDNNYETIRK